MSTPSLAWRTFLLPRPARIFYATGLTLLLGACTSMQDIPPGTSVNEIQARYGAPTVECPLPDGSRNMVWSTQPLGQYAWSTRVAPDGTAGAVRQILADDAFKQVEIGRWTTEDLQCTFGPPAEIAGVGLPSVRRTVWSYRYKQSGAWNSLMHIYLTQNGVVEDMHPGPDPLFEPMEWPLF